MEKIILKGMSVKEKRKVLEKYVGTFVEITRTYSFKKEEESLNCYMKGISEKCDECSFFLLDSGNHYSFDLDRVSGIRPINVSQAEEKNLFKIMKILKSIDVLEENFRRDEQKLDSDLDVARNKITKFRIGFDPTLIPEIIREELQKVLTPGNMSLMISVRIENYKIHGLSVAIDDSEGFYESFGEGLAERNYEGYWELNSESSQYKQLVARSEKIFDRAVTLGKKNDKKFSYEKKCDISISDSKFRLYVKGYLKLVLNEPIDLTKANLKKFLKLALKDLTITGNVSEINYDKYYSI